MDKNKIYCIIVIYKHNRELFNIVIQSIIEQVQKIIIVNNNKEVENFPLENIETIQLNDNYGIAYAQNIGIKKAVSEGANFVLTSDQDTIYPDGYITTLLDIYNNYKHKHRIAAVAPVFFDRSLKNEAIMPVSIYTKEKIIPRRNVDVLKDNVFFASHVISSGMLIPVDSIINIGLMKENYFIDWVDTEWCFRANMFHYKILQTSKIHVNHKHGERGKRIGKYILTEHTPIRRYYRVRNAIYMLLYEEIPFCFKKYVLISLLKMILMHFLQANDKKNEVINKYFAIKDALCNKMGPIQHKLG